MRPTFFLRCITLLLISCFLVDQLAAASDGYYPCIRGPLKADAFLFADQAFSPVASGPIASEAIPPSLLGAQFLKPLTGVRTRCELIKAATGEFIQPGAILVLGLASGSHFDMRNLHSFFLVAIPAALMSFFTSTILGRYMRAKGRGKEHTHATKPATAIRLANHAGWLLGVTLCFWAGIFPGSALFFFCIGIGGSISNVIEKHRFGGVWNYCAGLRKDYHYNLADHLGMTGLMLFGLLTVIRYLPLILFSNPPWMGAIAIMSATWYGGGGGYWFYRGLDAALAFSLSKNPNATPPEISASQDEEEEWFPPDVWKYRSFVGLRAVKILSRLRHPALPRVRNNRRTHEWETKWLDGPRLQDWIDEMSDIDDEQFLGAFLPKVLVVGEGLEVLHHAGIVHGDVSEHNIILHGDNLIPTLIDWDQIDPIWGGYSNDNFAVPDLVRNALIRRLNLRDVILVRDGVQEIFEIIEAACYAPSPLKPRFNADLLHLVEPRGLSNVEFIDELRSYMEHHRQSAPPMSTVDPDEPISFGMDFGLNTLLNLAIWRRLLPASSVAPKRTMSLVLSVVLAQGLVAFGVWRGLFFGYFLPHGTWLGNFDHDRLNDLLYAPMAAAAIYVFYLLNHALPTRLRPKGYSSLFEDQRTINLIVSFCSLLFIKLGPSFYTGTSIDWGDVFAIVLGTVITRWFIIPFWYRFDHSPSVSPPAPPETFNPTRRAA
jgi:hypothetical protein